MQNFQISGVPPAGPKNYVFVDEHNRHKRLKVMRACEGCRRRKIKCDAATTNSWPCAACKRLKLTCVPPVGGVEGEICPLDAADDQFVAHSSTTPVQLHRPDQFPYLHNYSPQTDPGIHVGYDASTSQNLYQTQDYYTAVQQDHTQLIAPLPPQYGQPRYSSFDSTNGNLEPTSLGSPQSGGSITAEELAESLGDLRIADSGVAPYIRQQNESQLEPPAPTFDDDEDLPPFPTAAGSRIRIPPALMPSDEEASVAFQDFFKHVHPYVPVLCRSYFCHQWREDRGAISPLLLEAVLACAGQVSGDPGGGSQWLALANRHEENFTDTPRLSTVQALLLLLKAREKVPKRGYFYRSWNTVRKIVGMSKDLDLHEHFGLHQSGGQCGSNPVECLTKTRVWQLAMMVELMVGAPQGRSDFGVDVETVDTSLAPPNSDMDDYEKTISRQFAYWVRNLRNIRGMTETYHKLKRTNKDWAKDPKFLAYNDDFRKWPDDVPADLKISMTSTGPVPVLPSHFLANMHCHYHLGIVMLYKPQLNASKDFANDEKWKMMFLLCYQSAKQVCLYQEATVKQFDVMGLACMLRGLSFPIYAILTCVMVHLVRFIHLGVTFHLTHSQIAITSPDTSLHQEAKSFFVRHMRILEKCIAEWPMTELETQVDGLRAAFSADLKKPFELKPTFPYGTPPERSKSPEARRLPEPQHHLSASQDQQYHQQSLQHGSYFPTPPISAGPVTKSRASSLYQEYNGDQMGHQYPQMPPTSNPTSAMTLTDQWNPTPIIDQFQTAFSIPQSALAPPPASSYSSSSPPVTLPQQNFHAQMQNQQYMPSPTSAGGYSSHNYTPSPTSQTIATSQTFPSPHAHHLTQPRTTPGHYAPQQSMNSYFDPNLVQGTHATPMSASQSYGTNGMSAGVDGPVYVTPKEWQQSVASVFDLNGRKRKWGHEQQMGIPQPAHQSGQYGRIG